MPLSIARRLACLRAASRVRLSPLQLSSRRLRAPLSTARSAVSPKVALCDDCLWHETDVPSRRTCVIATRSTASAGADRRIAHHASLRLAADINRCSRGRKLTEIANSHQARGGATEAWNWFQTLTGLRRCFQMPLRPRSFLVLLLLSCP